MRSEPTMESDSPQLPTFSLILRVESGGDKKSRKTRSIRLQIVPNFHRRQSNDCQGFTQPHGVFFVILWILSNF